MATLSKGQVFGATEQVTNTKLHNLVDLGSITNIVDADCSAAMNLQDTKLAQITTASKVSGSAIVFLPSIPSGAGLLPFANIPGPFGSSYVSLVSIPNASLFPLTLTSWVDGSAMRNIQSMPSLAGQLSWYSVCGSLASGGSPIFNGVDKFIGGNSTPQFSAGDYFVGGLFKVGINPTSTTPTKVLELYIPRSGTLRIKFFLAANAATANGQIYRNGSAVGTLRSNASTGASYSEDISGWSVGDLCQLYVYNSSGANDTYGIGLSLFEGTPITTTFNDTTYPVTREYTGTIAPIAAHGNVGDTYLRDSGGASTTLYVKTAAGTWTAK